MKHTLPPLPYALSALEPHFSEETLSYHYGKHHQTYVDKLNTLVADTPFENASLDTLIRETAGPVFNNAAQVWNHTFFWHCLTPPQSSLPTPPPQLNDAIQQAFGSLDAFKTAFSNCAINTFGSGWAWLVATPNNTLEIVSTSNAGNPMTEGFKPLLTCVVWEHAYYIDYRNQRPRYLEAFWHLVNWDFVARNWQADPASTLTHF